jgi:hypothetical protein
MKVYLSGPISNNRSYKEDFEIARERILRSPALRNVEVFSPVDLPLEGEAWGYCMKETLKLMLSCDAIVLLPTIKDFVSKGTVLEELVAETVGMDIWTLDGFIDDICSPPPF